VTDARLVGRDRRACLPVRKAKWQLTVISDQSQVSVPAAVTLTNCWS
jgi:hypothetical protein